MRTSGSATSSEKNGSTKIRCRDSGDAIPLPMRVATKKRNGVTRTQATKTALRRHVRASSTSPASASSSTTTRTASQPTVKSPATRARYFRIAKGLPSFVPPPPTPTSKRFASTVSLCQNGSASTNTAANGSTASRSRRAHRT